MDTFAQLRKQARDIREQAIAEAREEYASRLTRICALEQELLGARKTKDKSLAAAIERVIPNDRPFTTVDIVAALEALDERRAFRKSWLISHLGRLCERGVIRRVQKNHGREHAIYIRAGVEAQPIPFERKTLPLAVEILLRECGPLTPLEVAVRLKERKFRSTMTMQLLCKAVAACCRARTGKFVPVGAKWGLR